MSAETILHRLHDNGRTLANTPAYHEKQNGHWVATTWQDYVAQVRQAARALIALDVKAGDIVTALGFNTPEWVITDLATMLVGGAIAGIYTTNSPTEVQYIVEHAESSVILLEDEGQWEKIKQVRQNIPGLKHVIMMKKAPHLDDPSVMSWDDFMAKAESVPEEKVDACLNALQPDQLATLIYTSGTTGPPKGVMLSHHNLAWTSKVSGDLFGLNPSDSVLSYLPLSHIAEQMFTVCSAISSGYQVYYAEALEKVPDNLKEVEPTIFFGVPRVWERFYNGVRSKLSEATGLKAKIAEWAMDVGKQTIALQNQGQELTGSLALKYKLADKLIFSKVKPALGLGRVRHCISGAAPLNPEIMDFFSGLDINILEVYGQSEDCGPTSTNRPGATKHGTVGQVFPGTEVQLAEDGEILVKGQHVFMGYYKNEEATREDLVDDWLHSGDLGQFDAEGYLSIVGRKKEIMITAGGKNISPKNIEAALKTCNLISEAVLIADQRRFVSAVLTLEEEASAKFAQEQGFDAPWHNNPALVKAVQQEIDTKVNALFAQVEQVRKFTILPRDFTLEDGELTPTQKIKRRVVYENWATEIEAMYEA